MRLGRLASQRLVFLKNKKKACGKKKKLERARTEEKSLEANPAEIRYPFRLGAALLFIS